ncbi:hypothetical protein WA026_009340 [Henosepilachna vigintioctopunctata]|uniref:Uncharacterized protein n=1 Tax=Henosepilachna vigintioctopunctata TaxID=420089 RepID=A0AAW1UND6_9CUCU
MPATALFNMCFEFQNIGRNHFFSPCQQKLTTKIRDTLNDSPVSKTYPKARYSQIISKELSSRNNGESAEPVSRRNPTGRTLPWCGAEVAKPCTANANSLVKLTFHEAWCSKKNRENSHCIVNEYRAKSLCKCDADTITFIEANRNCHLFVIGAPGYGTDDESAEPASRRTPTGHTLSGCGSENRITTIEHQQISCQTSCVSVKGYMLAPSVLPTKSAFTVVGALGYDILRVAVCDSS